MEGTHFLDTHYLFNYTLNYNILNNNMRMKINKIIFTQLIAGIFFGTILGFAGFSKMMAYGVKHECAPNAISDAVCCGYDQCGSFGSIIGIILGSLFGVIAIIAITKFKTLNHSKVIKKFIFSALIIFFIYGIIVSQLSLSSFKDYLLFALPVISIHALLSGIISLIIIGIMSIGKIFLFKI